jgi:hypothetical protein
MPGAGVVADSLTRIHNAIVKYLLAVNRSCIEKFLDVQPCSESFFTYPSFMISVKENISHSKAKISDKWISHNSSLSAITKKIMFLGHILVQVKLYLCLTN